MKVIMFKPIFCKAVKSGKKRMTIRPVRNYPIYEGEEISLRRWKELPYRSDQITLLETKCKETRSIIIAEDHINYGGTIFKKNDGQIDQFARQDGFKDFSDMIKWFKNMHGLPFYGVCIRW